MCSGKNIELVNQVIVEGMKFCLAMTKTRAFRKYGGRMWEGRKMPGCEGLVLWSDAYLECLARQYTNTIYHHSGSAKMGPARDPTAVVDPRLRVHGIKVRSQPHIHVFACWPNKLYSLIDRV